MSINITRVKRASQADGRRNNGGKRPGAGRRLGVPNKVGKDLRALAQPYTKEALATLVAIMNDENAPPQARAMAADKILDGAMANPRRPSSATPRTRCALPRR